MVAGYGYAGYENVVDAVLGELSGNYGLV